MNLKAFIFIFSDFSQTFHYSAWHVSKDKPEVILYCEQCLLYLCTGAQTILAKNIGTVVNIVSAFSYQCRHSHTIAPPPPSSMLTMRKLQYSPIRDNRLFSTLYRGAGICPSLFWPGLSERLYKCIGGMGYGCTPV